MIVSQFSRMSHCDLELSQQLKNIYNLDVLSKIIDHTWASHSPSGSLRSTRICWISLKPIWNLDVRFWQFSGKISNISIFNVVEIPRSGRIGSSDCSIVCPIWDAICRQYWFWQYDFGSKVIGCAQWWFWIKDHSAVGFRLYIAVVDKMLINTKIQWSIQRSSSRSAHQLDMVFNGHWTIQHKNFLIISSQQEYQHISIAGCPAQKRVSQSRPGRGSLDFQNCHQSTGWYLIFDIYLRMKTALDESSMARVTQVQVDIWSHDILDWRFSLIYVAFNVRIWLKQRHPLSSSRELRNKAEKMLFMLLYVFMLLSLLKYD